MAEDFYIDGCPLGKMEIECARKGDIKGSSVIKKQFLNKIKETGIDHCPCQEKCPHHGNCYECVVLHRAHRDHVPYCFFSMINERLQSVAGLTEGTFRPEEPKEV